MGLEPWPGTVTLMVTVVTSSVCRCRAWHSLCDTSDMWRADGLSQAVTRLPGVVRDPSRFEAGCAQIQVLALECPGFLDLDSWVTVPRFGGAPLARQLPSPWLQVGPGTRGRPAIAYRHRAVEVCCPHAPFGSSPGIAQQTPHWPSSLCARGQEHFRNQSPVSWDSQVPGFSLLAVRPSLGVRIWIFLHGWA